MREKRDFKAYRDFSSSKAWILRKRETEGEREREGETETQRE